MGIGDWEEEDKGQERDSHSPCHLFPVPYSLVPNFYLTGITRIANDAR